MENSANTNNTIVGAVEQTAVAMLPEVAAAVGASNPTVAAVVALAPIAVQLLDKATQLSNAGAMPADQLASLFASIGKSIRATHDQWAAMNGAAK